MNRTVAAGLGILLGAVATGAVIGSLYGAPVSPAAPYSAPRVATTAPVHHAQAHKSAAHAVATTAPVHRAPVHHTMIVTVKTSYHRTAPKPLAPKVAPVVVKRTAPVVTAPHPAVTPKPVSCAPRFHVVHGPYGTYCEQDKVTYCECGNGNTSGLTTTSKDPS